MRNRTPLSISMCVPLGLLWSDCPCMLTRSGHASLLMCNGPWIALELVGSEPGTKEMEAVLCDQENYEHPAIAIICSGIA